MGNWKTDYIAVKFSPEEISVMKESYGRLLAKHDNDCDKAFIDPEMSLIFKHDVSAKLYAKNNWTYDPEVKNYVGYYMAEGLGKILPTKEQVCKMMFDTALHSHTTRDRILALKEYAGLMGYDVVDTGNNNSGSVQNVILLTDNGDTLSWEEKMLRQQHNLKEFAEKQLADVENNNG